MVLILGWQVITITQLLHNQHWCTLSAEWRSKLICRRKNWEMAETFCQQNATEGYSNLNGHINNYDEVLYKYAHCSNNSAIQQKLCPKSRLIVCRCPWEHSDYFFDAFLCDVREIQLLKMCSMCSSFNWCNFEYNRVDSVRQTQKDTRRKRKHLCWPF